jgi:hypothetical protein
MLGRLPPDAHHLRMLVEPRLRTFDDVFVFPASDAPIDGPLTGRTLVLVIVGPVDEVSLAESALGLTAGRLRLR